MMMTVRPHLSSELQLAILLKTEYFGGDLSSLIEAEVSPSEDARSERWVQRGARDPGNPFRVPTPERHVEEAVERLLVLPLTERIDIAQHQSSLVDQHVPRHGRLDNHTITDLDPDRAPATRIRRVLRHSNALHRERLANRQARQRHSPRTVEWHLGAIRPQLHQLADAITMRHPGNRDDVCVQSIRFSDRRNSPANHLDAVWRHVKHKGRCGGRQIDPLGDQRRIRSDDLQINGGVRSRHQFWVGVVQTWRF